MGRYFYNKKTTVEECKSISVVKLKKWGFFKESIRAGEFTWDESSIAYKFDREKKELRLIYAFTDNQDPKAKQDYKIRLSTTPCNLGGIRYWMHCPKCSRRVGKVYLAGKYVFACRQCWNLCYRSQNLVGFSRKGGVTISPPQLDEMRAKIRNTYYQGKPTKRYLKWERETKKFHKTFYYMVTSTEKFIDRMEKRFINKNIA